MSEVHSPSPRPPALPAVRLTLSNAGRATEYEVPHEGFLIGSVPGCDLRLAGTDLPPVICIITRSPEGAKLRKLSPSLPVQVNGRNASGTLADGDNLTIGTSELRVHIEAAAEDDEQPLMRDQAKLEAEVQKLEATQADRERRQAEVIAERQQLHQRQREMATERADFAGRLRELTDGRAKLEQVRLALAEQGEELKRKQEDVELIRRELTDLRRQLYEQYRERRDRVTALQEAVTRAARKVQEEKRAVEAEGLLSAERRREEEARRMNGERQQAQVQERLADLQERLAELEGEKQNVAAKAHELDTRTDTCLAHERTLHAERETLMREMEENAYHPRGREAVPGRSRSPVRQQAALERASRKLEAHSRNTGRWCAARARTPRAGRAGAALESWHQTLNAEAEALAKKKAEQEAVAVLAADREAVLTALQQQLERQQQPSPAAHPTRSRPGSSGTRSRKSPEQRSRLAEMEAEQERLLQDVQPVGSGG